MNISDFALGRLSAIIEFTLTPEQKQLLKEKYPEVNILFSLENRENLIHGVPQDKWNELVSLVNNGHKISAIKLYRQLTGLGLKESKDVIDTI